MASDADEISNVLVKDPISFAIRHSSKLFDDSDENELTNMEVLRDVA